MCKKVKKKMFQLNKNETNLNLRKQNRKVEKKLRT